MTGPGCCAPIPPGGCCAGLVNAPGEQPGRGPLPGTPKASLLAAIALCDWLAQRDVPLSEVRQGDIDDWLVEGGPSARSVRDFLDWTAERKTTARLVVPGRPSVEGTALDDHARWAIVERLLHDSTIDLTDRVAGCLVLLYAQQLSRLVGLTVEQVVTTDDAVHLRLGLGPVVIPEPLGHMLVTLATGGRAYVGVGSPTVHTWLFPGLYPGRPLHPSHLGQRLARYGIAVMPGRRAALMHLASRLPAAVLAEMLNLHPTTAVHWVAAAGGDSEHLCRPDRAGPLILRLRSAAGRAESRPVSALRLRVRRDHHLCRYLSSTNRSEEHST